MYRYFTVQLFRDDGPGPLGLVFHRQGGGLCINDIQNGAAAATWNSRCELTFPDDVLKKGDLIIRVNGIGSGKSTHAHRLAHNMQTYWTDAMMNELWQQSRRDYLLVVERLTNAPVSFQASQEEMLAQVPLPAYSNAYLTDSDDDDDSNPWAGLE